MPSFDITLDDLVYKRLQREAKSMGLGIEEYVRFELGYLSKRISMDESGSFGGRSVVIPLFSSVPHNMMKEEMRARAEAGELTCKNCTIKLTPEDVDNGKCGCCGALLFDEQ